MESQAALFSLPGKIPAVLEIQGLAVSCIIGDLPHERTTPQQIVLHVFLSLDLSQVAHSDSLNHTVNYVEVAALCHRVAVDGQYRMIETLAVKMAQAIRDTYPQVQQARVQLQKAGTIPHARAAVIDVTL